MKKLTLIAVAALAALSFTACTKKAQVKIESVEDLHGKTLGCQAGTTGEMFINDELEGVNVKSFKTGIDAALALKNGSIDAVVLDELPAKEIVRRNGDLKIVDAGIPAEEYAIAVRKGDEQLLSAVNATIRTIKENGTYENLVAAFMPVDGNINVPEDIESVSDEVIRMGTNAAFPPFEYTMGTKVVGFDATLSQIIARDFGKKLEIKDMNFDGLIAALQAGAIDFIAAGMTATEERRVNVDFSDPYFTSKQVVIVRK